ncbi:MULTISPECIES: TetR/AcrR family transcriptional regulator [Gordonia]|uniref:Putative TetR family transcriptional regulator n=1 Tax=Gordonia sihwensis NBRC 108236 TaxID=1223544 RepID=L7LJN8_9ACTN|nr:MULTISPECIES: TetR/AcrR family transcriptional regulator [Gordonia]AUH67516.1 TetR/AcrR family transcriptional regulator [Gordonia sp. YC-JH1]KXT56975.1 TetR family transcriptional regulator [Gordonia sp. QH-12]GAC61350.1 putative TetR family transcriptional regulator [Gordonia sihwensis NBRC 108236]
MNKNSGGRTYGGVSAAERQKQRRSALVEAGVELFGTEGYVNVSVKKICDEAGLTQRYFYESFPDRVNLLAAVYQRCVDIARSATIAAATEVIDRAGVADGPVPAAVIPILAEEALGGFINSLVEDPRRARVILIEVVGVAPEIEKLRLGAIHDWADLIAGFASNGRPTTPKQKLAAIGLVGAITQLLVDWQMALTDPINEQAGPDLFQVDSVHDVVTEMFVATYDKIFG